MMKTNVFFMFMQVPLGSINGACNDKAHFHLLLACMLGQITFGVYTVQHKQ